MVDNNKCSLFPFGWSIFMQKITNAVKYWIKKQPDNLERERSSGQLGTKWRSFDVDQRRNHDLLMYTHGTSTNCPLDQHQNMLQPTTEYFIKMCLVFVTINNRLQTQPVAHSDCGTTTCRWFEMYVTDYVWLYNLPV